MQGKRVLELGCGHGLPGILALMCGAEVHFQVRRSAGTHQAHDAMRTPGTTGWLEAVSDLIWVEEGIPLQQRT